MTPLFADGYRTKLFLTILALWKVRLKEARKIARRKKLKRKIKTYFFTASPGDREVTTELPGCDT